MTTAKKNPKVSARETALRRAGVPLSRAHYVADIGRKRSSLWLGAGVVIPVGYIGLMGGWALTKVPTTATPPKVPVVAQATPAIPAEMQNALAQQRRQKQAAEARAAEAQAKLRAVEERLARIETERRQQSNNALQIAPAQVAAAPNAAQAADVIATDCVPGLERLASNVVVPFDTGSVTPQDPALGGVAVLAEALALCPQAQIMVEGHTDRSGEEGLNLQLSWQRAENLIGWMESQGLDTRGFSAMGFGSRIPASEGDADPDAETFGLDRRVQFTVMRLAEPTE